MEYKVIKIKDKIVVIFKDNNLPLVFDKKHEELIDFVFEKWNEN